VNGGALPGAGARRAVSRAAKRLAEEKVLGWFDRRMEFGRARWARAILGDPMSPRMQAQMNLKIEFREGFPPFTPSVLRAEGRGVLGASRCRAREGWWANRFDAPASTS
jgi:carbamoyltransferase